MLRLGELGARLLVRPPSVTGVIDRLERMGLVSRTRSLDDLRARDVRLTDAGRQLVERLLVKHKDRIRSLMGVFAPAEQREMKASLDRRCQHLETMAQQEPAAEVD